MDFFIKYNLLVFIFICVFILYFVRVFNANNLLNTIIICSIIYLIFFKDLINKETLTSKDNNKIHTYPELILELLKEMNKLNNKFEQEECKDTPEEFKTKKTEK